MGWKSIIDHEQRQKMNLSNIEYMVFDFIHWDNGDGKFSDASVRKISKLLGSSLGTVTRSISTGLSKGYLMLSEDESMRITLPKWFQNAYSLADKSIKTSVTNERSKMEHSVPKWNANRSKMEQKRSKMEHDIYTFNRILKEFNNNKSIDDDEFKNILKTRVTKIENKKIASWVLSAIQDQLYIETVQRQNLKFDLSILNTQKMVIEFLNQKESDKNLKWHSETKFREHFRNWSSKHLEKNGFNKNSSGHIVKPEQAEQVFRELLDEGVQ